MKALFTTLTIALSFLILSGCGKSKKNSTNVTTACLAGQVQTTSGQCLAQGSCPVGQGWNGTACVAGTAVTPGSIYGGNGVSFSNTLQITSRDTFERFLEAQGLCNYSGYYTEQYGTYFGQNPLACSTYSSAGYVIMQFYPQASATTPGGNVPAFVTIGAGVINPNNDIYGNASLVAPVNTVAYIINDNTGFELYAQGNYSEGLSSIISLRTEKGNYMTDPNFETKLKYNGVEFARTFVNRHP